MVQPSGEIGVGTVIAETYVITALLGMGGMGAVWTAEHRRLPGKRVAIKVLLGATTDADSLARFRREAEIASRIGHPNIVEVLDFNELPSGTPYMILEYLEGDSLAARLRHGPMALEPALEIIRQVGSALHAAHREQVVHRDLKPDNIFLCPTDSGGVLTDRVKVLDFGISKIRGSQTVQTQESALLGTPQYMSPEQAYGRNKSIDQRTDVWALGAIVYEMLTGEPAFSGETLAHVIMSIVNDPAPTLKGRPGVPDRVASAVDRALRKNVEERFVDVGSFVAELTGRPLQTLDRKGTASRAVDALGSTGVNLATPAGPTNAQGYAPTEGGNATTPSVSTQPRGEVVPPTHKIEAPTPTKVPVWIGVALGVVGIGAAAFFGLAHKSPPPVEAPMHAAITPPPPPQVEVKPPPQQQPDIFKQPTVVAPPLKEHGKPTGPAVKETLPAEVVSDLDEAEKALSGGDTAQALHLARKTLSTKKSSRAFSIITRSYCRNGDLGNAKANVGSVSGGERAAVSRFCKKYDVDLH